MPYTPSPNARVVSTTMISPNLVAYTFEDESVTVARIDNDDAISFTPHEKERIVLLFVGAPVPEEETPAPPPADW